MRVLLVLALVATIASAQNPCSSFTTWSEPPSHDFDLEGDYPLGFRRASFGEDNDPPACLRVTSVENKKVEVLLEDTSGFDSRLCVADVSVNPAAPNSGVVKQCGVGSLHACFPASTTVDTLDLVVYCDESCESGEVEFFYRIAVSNVRWTDNQDDSVSNLNMWCMMRDSMEDTDGGSLVRFPSSLLPDDPETFPEASTVDASSAWRSAPLLLVCLFLSSTLTVALMMW